MATSYLSIACAEPFSDYTGGTDIKSGPFGRGVVLINTDYTSASVALVSFDGQILSSAFTGSGERLMSGDLAAPTMPVVGDDVVILDRANALVSWFDVRKGETRGQFHVDGDERGRNPWDYLPISPEKAYVTRYDRWPGKTVHGDVIVVNPKTASVLSPVEKRIPIEPSLTLPSEDDWVHPARGVVVGDRAYVTVVVATVDYKYSDSYLVVIDTNSDAVIEAKPLTGLHDCTSVALSPERDRLAIGCSGDLHAVGALSQERSALAVLSLPDLAEVKRISPSVFATGPVGFSLSFASSGSVLISTFGDGEAGTDDVAALIDLSTEKAIEVHRTGPVQLGAILCPARIDGAEESRAPEACFLTDAGSQETLRFSVNQGVLGDPTSIRIDDGNGHPPRYLGQF